MNIRIVQYFGLAALTLLLCHTEPALAQTADRSGQEAGSDTLDTYRLGQIIVSADRFENNSQTVGRNVTVITPEQIRQSLAQNMGELLDQQAGIHLVGSRQTPGSIQSLFLRHSDGNNTLVMIDGVRISDPSSTTNAVDLSELSLAGVERIEIVRGSHSTLYGSSAIGGVVNIITQKRAEEGTLATLETLTGGLQEGMFSTSNRLSLQGDLGGGFYAHGGVSHEYSNGMDATVDTASATGYNPQDRDAFNGLDLFAKTGYRGDLFDLYASYRRVDQSAEADQGAFDDDSNAKSDFTRDLIRYGVTADASDNLSFAVKGAWSTLERGFVNDSSIVDAQGNYDGIYSESFGSGTLWENDLTATLLSEGLRLTGGLESSRETMNNRSYTFSSAFNFESSTDLDSLDLEAAIYSGFLHADLAGSLLGDSWDSFSLVLGARLSGHDRFGTHVTYEVNPQFRLGDGAMIYGALTTGYNAPSLYQLYSPAYTPGYQTDRGNPNLMAEESASYELGWRQDLGENARFEFSLFRTNVTNAIEYIYLWNSGTDVSSLSFADHRGDTYINVSEQEITGLELSGSLQATPAFSFSGNISYIHSELLLDPSDVDRSYTGGNHVQIYESGVFLTEEREIDGLTRRPRFSANVSANWRPATRWRLGFSAAWTGERDDVFYSGSLGPFGALDRSGIDSYLLADLNAGYQATEGLWLGVRLENVFNSDYSEILGYNTRGRGLFLKARLTL